MSEFKYAIPATLEFEGGYVNDPVDAGGATKYGISLRFLKGLPKEWADTNLDGGVDVDDIKALKKEDAMAIYEEFWWKKYHYRLIDAQEVATKVFDMAVNMGATQAHKLLQRACQKACFGDQPKDDGVLGIVTLGFINNVDPKRLLALLRAQCVWFYEKIIERNPKQAKFKAGWLRRAAS